MPLPANMLPAKSPGSFSRMDPAVRNLIVGSVAALIGVVAGGLSVLGIVVAVTQPPNHDLRAEAGSRVDVAKPAPRLVEGALPVPAVPAVAAASAAPSAQQAAEVPPPPPADPQPSTPSPAIQAQTAPPLAPPTAGSQNAGPQKSWPDALTVRSQRAVDTSNQAQPSPTAAGQAKEQQPVPTTAPEQTASRPLNQRSRTRNADRTVVVRPLYDSYGSQVGSREVLVTPKGASRPGSRQIVTHRQGSDRDAHADDSDADSDHENHGGGLFGLFGGSWHHDDRHN